jgi:MFS superfamily sulfate permease-like transporter
MITVSSGIVGLVLGIIIFLLVSIVYFEQNSTLNKNKDDDYLEETDEELLTNEERKARKTIPKYPRFQCSGIASFSFFFPLFLLCDMS